MRAARQEGPNGTEQRDFRAVSENSRVLGGDHMKKLLLSTAVAGALLARAANAECGDVTLAARSAGSRRRRCTVSTNLS